MGITRLLTPFGPPPLKNIPMMCGSHRTGSIPLQTLLLVLVLPFKDPNIRIPIIIPNKGPIKGRGFSNQGLGLVSVPDTGLVLVLQILPKMTNMKQMQA